MSKMAFIDPATNVLRSWGFTNANSPGDLAIPIPDDFSLQPGAWQWTGQTWIPFTPVAPTIIQLLGRDLAAKWIQALVVYLGQIQTPPKTKAQVIADLLLIYQGLP